MAAFTFTVLFQNAFLSVWKLSLCSIWNIFGKISSNIDFFFLSHPLLSLWKVYLVCVSPPKLYHACELNFQGCIPLLSIQH